MGGALPAACLRFTLFFVHAHNTSDPPLPPFPLSNTPSSLQKVLDFMVRGRSLKSKSILKILQSGGLMSPCVATAPSLPLA